MNKLAFVRSGLKHCDKSQNLINLNSSLNSIISQLNIWWRLTESNRWPPACKAGALPTKLSPQLIIRSMYLFFCSQIVVGLTRLELVTPRLSSVCSNQLSYRPSDTSLWRTTCCGFLPIVNLSLRRWSSRRFPYGYLVTTSPQSSATPW